MFKKKYIKYKNMYENIVKGPSQVGGDGSSTFLNEWSKTWFQNILDRKNERWNYKELSANHNVTWKTVKDNPTFPWDYKYLSSNPNITFEIVQLNPEINWNYDMMSKNVNITVENVLSNPDLGWNYKNLFTYNQHFNVYENLQYSYKLEDLIKIFKPGSSMLKIKRELRLLGHLNINRKQISEVIKLINTKVDFELLSSNKNLILDIIINNKGSEWDWDSLSMNDNLFETLPRDDLAVIYNIFTNSDFKWNHELLNSNKSLFKSKKEYDILSKYIKIYPESLIKNPNITINDFYEWVDPKLYDKTDIMVYYCENINFKWSDIKDDKYNYFYLSTNKMTTERNKFLNNKISEVNKFWAKIKVFSPDDVYDKKYWIQDMENSLQGDVWITNKNISRNPNITWEIVLCNPDRPWDYSGLSENPNITIDIINANPDKDWDYEIFTKTNTEISLDIIQKYYKFSKIAYLKNPNLTSKEFRSIFNQNLYLEGTNESHINYKNLDINDILYIQEIVGEDFGLPLEFYDSNNINWEIIEKYKDFDWSYEQLIRHKNIPIEYILDNLDKFEITSKKSIAFNLAQNPNLKLKHIIEVLNIIKEGSIYEFLQSFYRNKSVFFEDYIKTCNIIFDNLSSLNLIESEAKKNIAGLFLEFFRHNKNISLEDFLFDPELNIYVPRSNDELKKLLLNLDIGEMDDRWIREYLHNPFLLFSDEATIIKDMKSKYEEIKSMRSIHDINSLINDCFTMHLNNDLDKDINTTYPTNRFWNIIKSSPYPNINYSSLFSNSNITWDILYDNKDIFYYPNFITDNSKVSEDALDNLLTNPNLTFPLLIL